MNTLTIRPAIKREIKEIAAWYIAERNKDPRFISLTRGPWQRFVFRTWVLPRYLRSGANTLVLEQEGRRAGFAVVEQGGDTVTLGEFNVEDGFDADGLLRALLEYTETLARERGYRYVRIAPLDSREARLALFRAAGFELVDYYLWCFTGSLSDDQPDPALSLHLVNPKAGLDLRVRYLRMELDASVIAARTLINETLLPTRPASFGSYRIERRASETAEAETIGYLSLRPDERQDGVLSLALSLDPDYWGTPAELGAAVAALERQKQVAPVPVRIMLSTTAHADRSQALYEAAGLQRGLDERPILFKALEIGA